MAQTYIGYSPDVEVLGEDEERLTAEILEIMATTNRRAFERHRHAVRDAHAKSHGFLKGELIVHELPSHLRQGLFARPANYPVVIRLSSAPGDIHSDTIPAPRGMAIKVIGVDGERLLPEDQGHNQDFLLVNIPTLSFGTIGKYRQLISLLEKNADNPAFLQRAMAGVARGVEAAVEAVGVEPARVLPALKAFKGLPHRVETVAEIGGVLYVDDSKGTNVGATLAAIEGMGRKVAIVLGGDGKGQDFSPLKPALEAHGRAIALIGRDAAAIGMALEGSGVPTRIVGDMAAAVQWLAAQAEAGDCVLLSPACASLDMYRNYAHRAQAFIDAVKELPC